MGPRRSFCVALWHPRGGLLTGLDHEASGCPEEVDWAMAAVFPQHGSAVMRGAVPRTGCTDLSRAVPVAEVQYGGLCGGAEPLALVVRVPDLRKSLTPLGEVRDHLSRSALRGK